MTRASEKMFPVSWDQFHRDARALAWRLSGLPPFSSIVAVTRGGMVPAAIIARELGLRVIETLSVASYGGEGAGPEQAQGGVKILKPVAPALLEVWGYPPRGRLMGLIGDLYQQPSQHRLFPADVRALCRVGPLKAANHKGCHTKKMLGNHTITPAQAGVQ